MISGFHPEVMSIVIWHLDVGESAEVEGPVVRPAVDPESNTRRRRPDERSTLRTRELFPSEAQRGEPDDRL